MIQSNLIVTTKTARFVEPTKRAFYDPPFGKNLETFGLIALLYDLQKRSSASACEGGI